MPEFSPPPNPEAQSDQLVNREFDAARHELFIAALEFRKVFGSEKRESSFITSRVVVDENSELLNELEVLIKEGKLTRTEYNQIRDELHELVHNRLSTGTTTGAIVDLGGAELAINLVIPDDMALAEHPVNPPIVDIGFSSTRVDEGVMIYGDIWLRQKHAETNMRVSSYDGVEVAEALRLLSEYFGFDFTDMRTSPTGTIHQLAEDIDVSPQKLSQIAKGFHKLLDDYNNGFIHIKGKNNTEEPIEPEADLEELI